jgi:tetratricopeptide (TPR) repeat protein
VSELPRLLGRIACGVTATLGVRLSADEERTLANERPVAPQSYLSYLKGRRQLSEGTEASSRAALASFEESCVGGIRDPRPHAAVVEASIALMETGCAADRDQLAQQARAELERASEIDAADPEALFAAAEVAYRLDWSLAVAEGRLRQLLASRPGHWRARLRLAECLIITGKFSDAIACAHDVVERQPFSARTLLRAGRVLHFARDYDAAVRVFTAALDRVPDSVVARFDLALSWRRVARRHACVHARNARQHLRRARARRSWSPCSATRRRLVVASASTNLHADSSCVAGRSTAAVVWPRNPERGVR